MSQTLRSFVAIDVPDQAKRALLDLVEKLKGQGVPGVRWVRPEGVHLTLKFLGNVDAAMIDPILRGIEAAAQGTPPFHLQLGDVGVFPSPGSPRVIWVGLKGDLEVLLTLQERIEGAMKGLGIPPEERNFVPHLALGRVQQGVPSVQRGLIGQALTSLALKETPGWRVESVNLMRSQLKPAGAVYNRLGQIHLLPLLSNG